ncbi:MAG: hypothetical protein PVJ39_04855 [Gammaproteobacteria bacterium]|jgi:hypothetical protein
MTIDELLDSLNDRIEALRKGQISEAVKIIGDVLMNPEMANRPYWKERAKSFLNVHDKRGEKQ